MKHLLQLGVLLLCLWGATRSQELAESEEAVHVLEKRGVDGDSYAQGVDAGYGAYDAHITKHVEITKPVAVPVVKVVSISVPQPVAVPFPQPVPVGVPQPVAVPVRVAVPVEVPVLKAEYVPVERPYPVEVERKVPVVVDKPYPVEVIKHVPVHVPQPFHVPVPVYKHIYHKPKHVWD